jgi:hypothetical protein
MSTLDSLVRSGKVRTEDPGRPVTCDEILPGCFQREARLAGTGHGTASAIRLALEGARVHVIDADAGQVDAELITARGGKRPARSPQGPLKVPENSPKSLVNTKVDGRA